MWVKNAKAMLRGDGTPIVLVACENITQRKEAEDALRQSEAYLAHAQELSHTGSFGLSLATGEAVWSRETFRIFQCDPATSRPFFVFHASIRKIATGSEGPLIGLPSKRKSRRRISPADAGRIGQISPFRGARGATRIRAHRISRGHHRCHRCKGGGREAASQRGLFGRNPAPSHTSSWAWDVRRQEFAYRSAELYRLFGFEPDQIDLPARDFQQRILPEDFRRIVEVERQAVRQREPFQIDFRIARPDGSIRRVHTEGHPVIGSDGEVMEIIGTHVDVTEQFAAKEALQRAFDELKTSESDSATMPKPHRTGSGRPARITVSRIYRSMPIRPPLRRRV